MVASEHPEVIDWRQWLVDTDVLDPEEAAEDGSIDGYGTAQYEEYDSGQVEAGVSTGVTEVVIKQMEWVSCIDAYYPHRRVTGIGP